MGLLLEGPEKVSGHPAKERDVLPSGLVMLLHAEPGNCPPASGKHLFRNCICLTWMVWVLVYLRDLLLGTWWFHSLTFLTKHFLSGRRLWVLQAQDQAMAPSKFPLAGKAVLPRGTHTDALPERESLRVIFVNTLKHFKNKIIAVKNTDSTELIPPTLNCYPGAAQKLWKRHRAHLH